MSRTHADDVEAETAPVPESPAADDHERPAVATDLRKGAAAPASQKGGALYFASIDGMRILASAGIVLFHLEKLGGLNDLHGSPGWLFGLIKGPAFHASLFFILGGFIYGSKLLPDPGRFSTAGLLKKRFRDLYPLHAATTMAMVVLMLFAAGKNVNLVKLAASIAAHLSGVWAFFPFGTYTLNTPSWALAAFFFCYALFGPMLRAVDRMKTPGAVFTGMALALIPMTLWSVIYGLAGRGDLYLFFHIFPPLRLFEFLIGMMAAKLFLLRRSSGDGAAGAIVNDLLIVLSITGVYYNVRFMDFDRPALRFFQYHVLMIPLYTLLLICLARGTGLIAAFFALPFMRRLGACSFYPYLLHIPFFSILCRILDQGFGYRTLLHSWINVALLMALLYGGSALAWNRRKKRRSQG